ncbi:TPA: D-lactate dehydrogenase [Acinetobacter baumannii]|nr:D-lactate dehydrogenase [Acinetobacter baumannii]
MENSYQQMFIELKGIVGSNNVLTDTTKTISYCKGFRTTQGKCLAVVIPKNLLELWKTLQVCVNHNVIILMQASNTSVTGGSTPHVEGYDRDVVIISIKFIKAIHLIQNAEQVIAFPGSTLTELENILKPYHKEPHSVIGSSCIGASIVGGVCNNSGGSLIQRGPAFTEKSLFAKINENGELVLVNHLGIDLGETPEEIINNLEKNSYSCGTAEDWHGKLWADDYADRLREIDSDQPTRYNGDPNYLHDCSGSTGKIAVFAVRLPTFNAIQSTDTFFISTDQEETFVKLRRFLLKSLANLPIQAEYIHRSAFDLTVQYAKHMYKVVDFLGPEKIPQILAIKNNIDEFVRKIPLLPNHSVDLLIQLFNRLSPNGIEKRISKFHEIYEHHLMIKIDSTQRDELKNLLDNFFNENSGDYFLCTPKEAKNAFLIRFAVGGCAAYYCDSKNININERLVAFDVALRANDSQFGLELPKHLKEQVEIESCCGHFFCYVLHQDYLLKPGYDVVKFKKEVMSYIEKRRAKYPAEHNVGHMYSASEEYKDFMRKLDPTNTFNSGVGKTSKKKFWA